MKRPRPSRSDEPIEALLRERKALDWRPPHARWFVGGRLNAADHCLDRHVEGPRRNKAAPGAPYRVSSRPSAPVAGEGRGR